MVVNCSQKLLWIVYTECTENASLSKNWGLRVSYVVQMDFCIISRHVEFIRLRITPYHACSLRCGIFIRCTTSEGPSCTSGTSVRFSILPADLNLDKVNMIGLGAGGVCYTIKQPCPDPEKCGPRRTGWDLWLENNGFWSGGPGSTGKGGHMTGRVISWSRRMPRACRKDRGPVGTLGRGPCGDVGAEPLEGKGCMLVGVGDGRVGLGMGGIPIWRIHVIRFLLSALEIDYAVWVLNMWVILLWAYSAIGPGLVWAALRFLKTLIIVNKLHVLHSFIHKETYNIMI